jgi:hypothetical protein
MTDEPALFAIVPLPPLGPARDALLREAIAYGGGDELLRKFFACEQVERELANQQRQTVEAAQRVADIGAHLMDQVEALTAQQIRQDRLDAKRKADAARRAQEDAARQEQAEILEYLETHPEPGASTDDTHHPGGELHALDPVDKEHLDPAEDDADLEGLVETRPVIDPAELAYPPKREQMPQIAISLNEEIDA